MDAGAAAAPPPLQLLVREKGKAELRNVSSEQPFATAPSPLLAGGAPDSVVKAEHSPDGRLVACVNPDVGVSVVSTETGELVASLARAKVSELAWSPKCSYLLTWGRWEKDDNNLMCAAPPSCARAAQPAP